MFIVIRYRVQISPHRDTNSYLQCIMICVRIIDNNQSAELDSISSVRTFRQSRGYGGKKLPSPGANRPQKFLLEFEGHPFLDSSVQ